MHTLPPDLIERIGRPRGLRAKSYTYLWGLPVYEIALGSNAKRKEKRGHARALIAIGDIATGVIAIGGVARGLVAIGGISLGVVSIGGLSLGVLFSLGGLAIGTIAAGGVAIGLVALGAATLGMYCCGAIGYGQHVIDITHRDSEAFTLFTKWLPGLRRFLGHN